MNREGWVPIRLKWEAGTPVVDWCWLGASRFTEPFFDNTIDRAQRLPFNALFTHRTSMAELGAWYETSPGLTPNGFIFHMSRCGSTLISRMMAALPDTVVISEAAPLDHLARAEWLPAVDRARWLRWMVSALCQKRIGTETRCFIKFDSTTVLALPFIRKVFPAVPWIFVYRNPEEVIVSHLNESAAAMAPGMITDLNVTGAQAHEIFAMSHEEYAARVIGRLCEAARDGLDSHGMLVNYTQLPDAVSGEIANHFGIVFSSSELVEMNALAQYHAKRPERRFSSDTASKQIRISEAVRAAAFEWVWPVYNELERLRQAGSFSIKCLTSSPPYRTNPSRS